MRILIQRVSSASVTIDGHVSGRIQQGLLILLGIAPLDTQEDVDWLCKKVMAMRIFSDADGKMNLSVADIDGGLLVVSQFTLFASTKKGNRPGFTRSAHPDVAVPLYESFVSTLSLEAGRVVATGTFGADMQVELINDGPVTILVDSRNRE
ncbi:D-aminoacyl-tRNA deacylase [Neolewinella antarctica]|uniref:D-aminoacyl-tRNA deacylase n=1 Tax=Neolewinella antarctica TaxID=442734 RepID=A0ABX0XFX6_9BACT|nr:D-aminoacyl-tRNA deacylase [Neolewinella antarctica]NJC28215.1 D-tyrosyl-tRNA(Tyr) deacylase [Neolewinella antarctica]